MPLDGWRRKMKRYKQGIEFIDFVKKFHRTLHEFYTKLENEAEKEKVKMVLGYLSEREQHMEETIESVSDSISKKVEDTWFSFCDENEAHECLNSIKLNTEISIEQIMGTVIRLDECLINLFNKLEKFSESEEVKAVFQNLAELESRELKRVILNFQRMDDL
jgi:rubrerythrin